MKKSFAIKIASILLSGMCVFQLAACETEGDSSSDGSESGVVHTHTLSYQAAQAATCDKDGHISYWLCGDCGKAFEDENGKKELDASKIKNEEALGHILEQKAEQIPTCSNVGWAAYEYCTREGCTYTTYQQQDALFHNFVNGECTNCDATSYSQGLSFKLNSEETGYKLVGSGTCEDTCVVIPSEYNGLPVTEIEEIWCQGIKKIVVPKSVQIIKREAFQLTWTLEEIVLPFLGYSRTNLEPISYYFGFIFGYEKYEGKIGEEVPKGVRQYRDNQSVSYYYKIPENLKRVTITEDPTDASEKLNSCSMLECIQFDCPVQDFGTNFKCAVSISDVKTWCEGKYFAGEDRTKITELLINGERVTNLVIPEGTKKIKEGAFFSCKYVETLTIPDSVYTVERKAFYGGNTLKTVNYSRTLSSEVWVVKPSL